MARVIGWFRAGGGARGHVFVWPAPTAPVSNGGLRSFQSLWFGPDGLKTGGGFRSFDSLWFGPDGETAGAGGGHRHPYPMWYRRWFLEDLRN